MSSHVKAKKVSVSGPALISFTAKLQSIKKSTKLKINVRADRELTEDVTVSWETVTATKWTDYERLTGDIKINKGDSMATLLIDGESLKKYQNQNFSTGSSQINLKEPRFIYLHFIELSVELCHNYLSELVLTTPQTVVPKLVNFLKSLSKRNRSNYEIDEIDQIVFRLNEIKSGQAVINSDNRTCCVALLDDSVYMDKIESLNLEIETSKSRLSTFILGFDPLWDETNQSSLNDQITKIEETKLNSGTLVYVSLFFMNFYRSTHIESTFDHSSLRHLVISR